MSDVAKKCAQACGLKYKMVLGYVRLLAKKNGYYIWDPETNPAQAWLVENELIRRAVLVDWCRDELFVMPNEGESKNYPFTTPAERMQAVCRALADLSGEKG